MSQITSGTDGGVRFLDRAESDSDSSLCTNVIFRGEQAYVSKNHFLRQSEAGLKRKLFKNTVRRVAVEIFSYCNRRCYFCPNKAGSRLGDQKFLDKGIFFRILNDLASIDFDGRFGFTQFNEPLSDRIILERIAQARQRIPRATLFIPTNGDYLNRAFLRELYDAGLRWMSISVYGPNHGVFDDEYVRRRTQRISDELELETAVVVDRPGETYMVRGHYQEMKIDLLGRNFDIAGYDRGGLIKEYSVSNRTSPCFFPFLQMNVDWQGNVVPCCNVYADDPDHAKWVIGNLGDGRSIFDHYADSSLVDWRRNLFGFFHDKEPCSSCSRREFPELATDENVKKFEQFAQSIR
ncbi:MAG TPA: radical SAM/SPASM domain-containing protein [Gammaproteobacteria bacterium]|nr:radical SAM/SPASM domain-containing protein [Gammaproteobacteria bacterium]